MLSAHFGTEATAGGGVFLVCVGLENALHWLVRSLDKTYGNKR